MKSSSTGLVSVPVQPSLSWLSNSESRSINSITWSLQCRQQWTTSCWCSCSVVFTNLWPIDFLCELVWLCMLLCADWSVGLVTKRWNGRNIGMKSQKVHIYCIKLYFSVIFFQISDKGLLSRYVHFCSNSSQCLRFLGTRLCELRSFWVFCVIV